MPRIVLTSTVAASLQDCFDLSLSVDAHTASLTGSDEQIVDGVRSGTMALGDTVTWRARHFGVWFTMTSRISEYDGPTRFVDEQVSGPFGHWWHEHRFEEQDGVTVMRDTVDFASPFGPLGRLVDRVLLKPYMTGLLEKRNAWLVSELA